MVTENKHGTQDGVLILSIPSTELGMKTHGVSDGDTTARTLAQTAKFLFGYHYKQIPMRVMRP